MKIKILLTILLFLFAQMIYSVDKKAVPKGKQDKEYKIFKIYKGIANSGYDLKENKYVSNQPMVIKSKKDLDTLISLIPKKEISMMSNAPKSKDPLLKKPNFNFKQFMLIAVFSDNMYDELSIKSISIVDNVLKVKYEVKKTEMSLIGQRPLEAGKYLAIYVKSFSGKVEFEATKVESNTETTTTGTTTTIENK